MEEHNKKLKSLGWEYVPESSGSGYDTFMKYEERRQTTMVVEHKGDGDDKLIILRTIEWDGVDWNNQDTSITAMEYKAISSLLDSKDFFYGIIWGEHDGKYWIKKD